MQYLAPSLQWAVLHCPSRRAAQWSREEKAASTPCDKLSPHCDCVWWRWLCDVNMIERHLIVWKRVQLALPATQELHESRRPDPPFPPQTTSLPPHRRERLWPRLGWGKSGMEQASEGGNNSTLERRGPLSHPPTTTCPDKSWHHQYCHYPQVS